MKTRKNIRIEGYDYTEAGYYFITVCTKDKREVFGRINNDQMILNSKGVLVKSILENYNTKSTNAKNDFYQIMPDHIHLIIRFIENNNENISTVVSRLKGKCTRELKIKDLWQRNFYERIIRNEKEYVNILEYIKNNPYKDKYIW